MKALADLGTVQNLGHIMAAVRIDLFGKEDEFRERMDSILGMLKASPPAPGTARVRPPGEMGRANESKARNSFPSPVGRPENR